MGFVYEELSEAEWLELKEKYHLRQWAGNVRHCLKNKETGMIFLNLGGQDHWERPYEYAIIYKNTASIFETFRRMKGEDKKLVERHILNITLAKEIQTEAVFLKESIVEVLTFDNDLSNERFLELHPDEKPYSIEFVFEEGR